ncbi:hypothetical protein HK101_008590, partial [Irineochytrium annulatum]
MTTAPPRSTLGQLLTQLRQPRRAPPRPTPHPSKSRRAGGLPRPLRRLLKSFLLVAVALAGTGTALVMTQSREPMGPMEALGVAIAGAGRCCVSLTAGCAIGLMYRRLFGQFTDYTTDEYKAARAVVHQKAAEWLLWLARTQGGIYVKAAQHIASLTYIVPNEFTSTLSVLQDRAPFRPWSIMGDVLRKELDVSDLGEIFDEISEVPIAAASLAQVHRARTKDGEAVAVKIQYPDVVKLFEVDTRTMQLLSDLAGLFFNDFSFGWIVSEFKTSLASEFDFTNEAKNSDLTHERFRHRREAIRCPTIRWELTTKRVLVMEFIEGIKVNDFAGIREKLGLNPRDVGRLVCEAFSEMIFLHGVVHCDPHAGNMLVVRCEADPRKPTLVILDHGLYRTLDDKFRVLYSNLWKAILLNDMALLKEVAEALGVGQYFSHFPLILTGRPIGSRTPLGGEINDEERKKIRSNFKSLTFSDLMGFLENLPRDMLFAFRVANLVRGIHRELYLGDMGAATPKLTQDGGTTDTAPATTANAQSGGSAAPMQPQDRRTRDLIASANAERLSINARYAIKGSWCIGQVEREAGVQMRAAAIERVGRWRARPSGPQAPGAAATVAKPGAWAPKEERVGPGDRYSGVSIWRPAALLFEIPTLGASVGLFRDYLWLSFRLWVARLALDGVRAWRWYFESNNVPGIAGPAIAEPIKSSTTSDPKTPIVSLQHEQIIEFPFGVDVSSLKPLGGAIASSLPNGSGAEPDEISLPLTVRTRSRSGSGSVGEMSRSRSNSISSNGSMLKLSLASAPHPGHVSKTLMETRPLQEVVDDEKSFNGDDPLSIAAAAAAAAAAASAAAAQEAERASKERQKAAPIPHHYYAHDVDGSPSPAPPKRPSKPASLISSPIDNLNKEGDLDGENYLSHSLLKDALESQVNADEDPKSVQTNEVKLGSNDGLVPSWTNRRKQFFILSSAGKPIYSRYGDEAELTAYMGIIQAIISFFINEDDSLMSLTAGDYKYVFLTRGPLYLVAVAASGESTQAVREIFMRLKLKYAQLTRQLETLYDQILFILTSSQLTRIFDQRVNYDLRNLISGTEMFFDELGRNFHKSPSNILGAPHCLRMPFKLRQQINSILSSNQPKTLLYAILIAKEKIISYSRTRKYPLHAPDLLLLVNMVNASSTFRSAESWTPICLPVLNSRAFVHAYVCFLGPDLCLILVSPDKDSFFDMSEFKQSVVRNLDEGSCVDGIDEAINNDPYRQVELGVPYLRHFVSLSKPAMMFTEPHPLAPYTKKSEYRRLLLLFELARSKLASLDGNVKVVYVLGKAETVLAVESVTPKEQALRDNISATVKALEAEERDKLRDVPEPLKVEKSLPRKGIKIWAAKDDAKIRRYGGLSAKELHTRHFPDRTLNAVIVRRGQLRKEDEDGKQIATDDTPVEAIDRDASEDHVYTVAAVELRQMEELSPRDNGKRWLAEDDEVIRLNASLTVDELHQQHFRGRSRRAVQARRRKLFAEDGEDDADTKALAATGIGLTKAEVTEGHDPTRDAPALIQVPKKKKAFKSKLWSAEEVATLQLNRGLTVDELHQLFPGRKRKAIRTKLRTLEAGERQSASEAGADSADSTRVENVDPNAMDDQSSRHEGVEPTQAEDPFLRDNGKLRSAEEDEVTRRNPRPTAGELHEPRRSLKAALEAEQPEETLLRICGILSDEDGSMIRANVGPIAEGVFWQHFPDPVEGDVRKLEDDVEDGQRLVEEADAIAFDDGRVDAVIAQGTHEKDCMPNEGPITPDPSQVVASEEGSGSSEGQQSITTAPAQTLSPTSSAVVKPEEMQVCTDFEAKHETRAEGIAKEDSMQPQ